MTEDDPPPDSDPGTIETAYEERPPSVAVVAAVAAVDNTPPTDLEFSLQEHIDPDALDALFADDHAGDEADPDLLAEFTLDEYVVQVRDDGTLTVTAPDSPE